MRRLGVHTSIAGGLHTSLERAKTLGCTTLQIFSHNPRSWAVRELSANETELFRRVRYQLDISPVYIHTSYLINIATHDSILRERSLSLLIAEMDRADTIGADYVILHTGSAKEELKADSQKRAVSVLNDVSEHRKWNAKLLLENTAGERGDISSAIEDLALIMHGTKGDLIGGVCIDTCHLFAAGYDIRKKNVVKDFLETLYKIIGPGQVKCIHLNDARGSVGSHLDRHEHIGKGKIGTRGLQQFICERSFRTVPVILETPKKNESDDPMNLRKVRRMIKTQ